MIFRYRVDEIIFIREEIESSDRKDRDEARNVKKGEK